MKPEIRQLLKKHEAKKEKPHHHLHDKVVLLEQPLPGRLVERGEVAQRHQSFEVLNPCALHGQELADRPYDVHRSLPGEGDGGVLGYGDAGEGLDKRGKIEAPREREREIIAFSTALHIKKIESVECWFESRQPIDDPKPDSKSVPRKSLLKL